MGPASWPRRPVRMGPLHRNTSPDGIDGRRPEAQARWPATFPWEVPPRDVAMTASAVHAGGMGGWRIAVRRIRLGNVPAMAQPTGWGVADHAPCAGSSQCCPRRTVSRGRRQPEWRPRRWPARGWTPRVRSGCASVVGEDQGTKRVGGYAAAVSCQPMGNTPTGSRCRTRRSA